MFGGIRFILCYTYKGGFIINEHGWVEEIGVVIIITSDNIRDLAISEGFPISAVMKSEGTPDLYYIKMWETDKIVVIKRVRIIFQS